MGISDIVVDSDINSGVVVSASCSQRNGVSFHNEGPTAVNCGNANLFDLFNLISFLK